MKDFVADIAEYESSLYEDRQQFLRQTQAHNLGSGLVRQLSDEPVEVEGSAVGEGGRVLLKDEGETQGIFPVPATILQARGEYTRSIA